MSQKIKVTFVFESDNITDEEYYNQPEQEFYITEEMIIDLIEDYMVIPKGFEIDLDTLTINKI
jgi:hypothetical protein